MKIKWIILEVALIMGFFLGCSWKKNANIKETAVSTNEVSSDDANYENYLNGTEKVSVKDVYQENTDFVLREIFEIDEYYDIYEFSSCIIDAMDLRDDTKKTKLTYEYVDCGCDGEKELMVIIDVPGAWAEGCQILYIVKNIEGKLCVLYLTERANNSYTVVTEKGYVWKSGKKSANVVNYTCGYLDDNVNYHFYYGFNYYLNMDSFINEYFEMTGNEIDAYSADWQDVQVVAYYLSDKREFNQDDFLYSYSLYDKNGNLDFSVYDDDSIYKKTFKECGIKTYTEEEIEVYLNTKKQIIGLDEDIIEK